MTCAASFTGLILYKSDAGEHGHCELEGVSSASFIMVPPPLLQSSLNLECCEGYSVRNTRGSWKEAVVKGCDSYTLYKNLWKIWGIFKIAF